MNKQILISTIIALSAVGITSAYAINLDLKADTTVTGDFDVTGTISGIGTVPIGTVLDWWCSSDCTIPDGFVIADGQLISDSASPFDGENVPDLTDTFIHGVTNVGNVGTTGGSSSHSHTVNPPSTPSQSAGSHTHTVDPDNINLPFEEHNHRWGKIDSDEKVITFDSAGGFITIQDWTDGIGNEGQGYFPFALFCSGNECPFATNFFTQNDRHTHSIDIPQFNSGSDGSHSHSVNIGSFSTGIRNHEPPWYGLVKIIRIK